MGCEDKGMVPHFENVFVLGVVRDILVVPVGISYDMLVERNFVRHELMVRKTCIADCRLHPPLFPQGGSKRPETFLKAMGGVWAMLTRNAGSIRIDFAQPFSLQVLPYIIIVGAQHKGLHTLGNMLLETCMQVAMLLVSSNMSSLNDDYETF